MGPTASGKTDLAVAMAGALSGELVNADSRQAIEELAVGVGKPTPDELRGIVCHGLDWAHLGQAFSAAAYRNLASCVIHEILGRQRTPLIVGGTGLYVRALLGGFDFGGVAPQTQRAKTAPQDREGDSVLVLAAARDLQLLDASRAAQVDFRNPRRVVRAAELSRAGARPGQSRPGWLSRKLACQVSSARLRERIEARSERMVAEPFAAEVAALLAQGYSPQLLARSAIGYAEVVDWLAGRCPRQEAAERVASRTWRYARAQMTWLRTEPDLVWVDADTSPDQTVKQCLALVEPGRSSRLN